MKKIILVAFVLLTCIFSVHAKKNKVDYASLASEGSAEEITDAFKSSDSLPTQVFGGNRETFLMMALKADRDIEVLKICINNESDVGAKAKDGRTCSMFAAEFVSDPEAVSFVVKAGTLTKNARKNRVLQKDKSKKNSFDYARKNKNPEVYNALLEFAEDPNGELAPGLNQSEENTAEEYVVQEIAETAVASEVADEQVGSAPLQVEEPVSDAPSVVSQVLPQEGVESEIIDVTAAAYFIEESIPDPEGIFSEPEVEVLVEEEPEPTPVAVEEIPAEPPVVSSLEKMKEEQLSLQRAEIKQYTQAFLYDYEEEPENEETKVEPEKKFVGDPNKADKNGVTLLMHAAKAGNDWDVQNLLENGADVQMRDKDGWTALMYACRYQNSVNIVNMLIEKGAYIRVRNKYNATPLLMAADFSQNPEIIRILLKNRASSEDEVFRAFVFAITGNSGSDHIRTAKIKLFIDMGIPLNRIWQGQTPLMYAAQYCSSTAVLKILLDAGAKTNIQNSEGKTAFDYAKANKKLPHDDIYWSLN